MDTAAIQTWGYFFLSIPELVRCRVSNRIGIPQYPALDSIRIVSSLEIQQLKFFKTHAVLRAKNWLTGPAKDYSSLFHTVGIDTLRPVASELCTRVFCFNEVLKSDRPSVVEHVVDIALPASLFLGNDFTSFRRHSFSLQEIPLF